VVTSEANPHGLFSVVSGYPKTYDSNTYDGNMEAALRAAKSEYYARLSANYAGSTARVMATVTLEQANGQMILRDSTGAFPVIEPEPVEPESPSEVNGDEEGN